MTHEGFLPYRYSRGVGNKPKSSTKFQKMTFRNMTAHISSFKTNFSSNFSVKFSNFKISKPVKFRLRKFLLHLFDRQISSFKLHKFQAIFHLSEIISEMIYEISGRHLPFGYSHHYIHYTTHMYRLVLCNISVIPLIVINYCNRLSYRDSI